MRILVSGFVAASLASFTALSAAAAPIQLFYTGTGSGQLDGEAFDSSDFTITANADTDDVVQDVEVLPGLTVDLIPHTSASISINGVGSFDFVNSSQSFNNDQFDVVGFQTGQGLSPLDLYNIQSTNLDGWNTTSSIGPTPGTGDLQQWNTASVAVTDGGSDKLLTFLSGSTNATFQATTLVPSPPSLADLARASQCAYCEGANCESGAPAGYEIVPGQNSGPGVPLQIMQLKQTGTDKVVLAIRGTELKDSEVLAENIRADASFLLESPTEELRDLVFASAVLVRLAIEEYGAENIILTGHSLGGAVAQSIGAVTGIETTVFNSPGMGEQIEFLTNELRVVADLFESPTVDITNVRVYGDQVSPSRFPPIEGSVTITYDSNIDHETLEKFAVQHVSENHKISTVIRQIEDPNVMTYDGFAGPEFTSDDVRTSIVSSASIYGYQFIVDAAIDSIGTPIGVSPVFYILDPPPAYGYLFESGLGDPLFRSVVPSNYGDSIGYKLELLTEDGWAFEADMFPATFEFEFDGDGVDTFRLLVYDFLANEYIIAPGFFVPAVSFASDGFFSGSITLLDLNGAPLQPVPLPAALPLFAGGLGLLGFIGWRRKRAAA